MYVERVIIGDPVANNFATVTALGELKVIGTVTVTGAGDASAANQVAGNVLLASIDAGIPAGLGQATMANSMPVVIASNQSAIPVTGTVTVTGAGDATAANQVLQTAALNSIDAGIPAGLGQTSMSASMPVVLASDQTAIPVTVSGTVTVTGAGDATAANQATEIGHLATISTAVSGLLTDTQLRASAIDVRLTADAVGLATEATLQAIEVGIPDSLGQQTMAKSMSVVLASNQTNIPVDIVANTVGLAKDTTVSATNVLLATTNASLASIDAGVPAALGQTTMANSMPVVLASNQSAITVTGTVAVTGAGDATAANQVLQLAQETAAATSLAIMDDWDETDRCKVNLIASQAGIAGGTGVDGANVPRFTLATNVGLPAGSNVIGHVIHDSGSTTVVTGNVTVIQPTGTNLHTVIDSGTITTVSTVTNLSQLAGQAISMNTGVRDAGTQRVTIATNDVVPVSQSGGWSVSQSGSWTLSAGSALIGKVSIDQTSPGTANAIDLKTIAGGSSISTSNGVANAGTIRVAIASDNTAFTVNIGTPPTLTKGTQGSTGFSVQNLIDAGRTAKRFYTVGGAAGSTGAEQAFNLTASSQDSATTNSSDFTPSNGKTFRITAVMFATRGHSTATAQVTTFSIRMNTAGAVGTTSTPILLQARCATPATALAWDRIYIEIPEGIEIYGDGTKRWGVTTNSTYTTNAPTLDVMIIGYEY